MPENDRTKHPAYGVVNINRVQGSKRLFQSDFLHHNYISLTISTAEKVDRFGVDSTTWADDRIVEIQMSEAQFSRMIASLNMGEGAPCTLGYVQMPESLAEYSGKLLPRIEREDVRETHKDKVKELVDARLEDLDKIKARLVGWREAKHRPTLSELDDLLSKLSGLHLASNFAFIQEVLEEKMETTVEEGRIEIEAHISQMLAKVGLDQVQREALPETPYGSDEPRTITEQ